MNHIRGKNLLMDFDDMLTFAHAILQRYPNILKRYTENIPLFVD